MSDDRSSHQIKMSSRDVGERAKSIDQRKDEGLAVLSHDLRAPLNVQLGHAYLLMKDPQLSEKQRASVETIERTGRKILDLIERMLDSARAKDRSIELVAGPADLSFICHDVANDLAVLAEEKGIELKVDVPERLVVSGDGQMLRQVLQNLISNAITHATLATVVSIRGRDGSRGDRNVVRVDIQDDGHVTDREKLLRSFELSQGLGLAICRHFVERHGGHMEVIAPIEGGAMFSFVLPRDVSNAFLKNARGLLHTTVRDRDSMTVQLQAEISRSARYGRPLTVAAIRAKGDSRPHVNRSSQIIASAIRSTDAMGYAGEGAFLLILPETSSAVVGPLLQRIVNRLEGGAMSWVIDALEVGDVALGAETLIAQLLS